MRPLTRLLPLGLCTATLMSTTPAWALPTHAWLEAPSSAGQISAVDPGGPADSLVGARATVFYSDGSSDTALFAGFTSGLDSWAVAQTASFALVAASSGSGTSAPDFSLSNTDRVRTLVRFDIDGFGDGAGQAAFDRGLGVLTPHPGTPGSNNGTDLHLDFSRRSFLTGTVTVTYRHALGLAGAAPVGDLFRAVSVQMDLGTVVGLPPVTAFSAVFSNIDFDADIDTVAPVLTVPEPGSAALLALGLAALGVGARRQRRTAAAGG